MPIIFSLSPVDSACLRRTIEKARDALTEEYHHAEGDRESHKLQMQIHSVDHIREQHNVAEETFYRALAENSNTYSLSNRETSIACDALEMLKRYLVESTVLDLEHNETYKSVDRILTKLRG